MRQGHRSERIEAGRVQARHSGAFGQEHGCQRLFASAAKGIRAGGNRTQAPIRIRAERKTGQLLKQMDGKGSHGGNRRSSRSERLENVGVSKDQSSKWQKLAEVPDKDFENYLSEPGVPTTTGALDAGAGKRSVRQQAPPPDSTTEARETGVTQQAVTKILAQEKKLSPDDPPPDSTTEARETGVPQQTVTRILAQEKNGSPDDPRPLVAEQLRQDVVDHRTSMPVKRPFANPEGGGASAGRDRPLSEICDLRFAADVAGRLGEEAVQAVQVGAITEAVPVRQKRTRFCIRARLANSPWMQRVEPRPAVNVPPPIACKILKKQVDLAAQRIHASESTSRSSGRRSSDATADQKIEEQAKFVRWWDDNIGINHGAGRGKKRLQNGNLFLCPMRSSRPGFVRLRSPAGASGRPAAETGLFARQRRRH